MLLSLVCFRLFLTLLYILYKLFFFFYNSNFGIFRVIIFFACYFFKALLLGWLLLKTVASDLSHFTDFEQVKIFSDHFDDFQEQQQFYEFFWLLPHTM